jgi:Uma2 family endonuclease
MAQRIPPKATEADFRALPDDRKAHLVEGQIYCHARPRVSHAELIGALHQELANTYRDKRRGGPGGWVFLIEPELKLGQDILAPDIAGWRRERMPRAPAATSISLAPDWICEVLSKGTESFDRGAKRRSYLRAGVSHLWYVQPEAKHIEVYRKHTDLYASVAEGTFIGPIALEPFAEAPIDLGELGEWCDDTAD